MGVTNYGNQTTSFTYGELGKSQNFNKINYKLVEKGIYIGGVLTKVDDTHIDLSPLLCYVEDSYTKIGVRVSTTDILNIEVSSVVPYIILRYVWVNTENNYADIISSTYADILEDDLIIGRCVFDGSTLDTDFDYSRRHDAILAINENKKDYLKVIAQEPYSTTVTISAGSFYTKQKVVNVIAGNSPVISNTSLGRTDLIYIDNTGTILVEEGIDSGSPITPNHKSRTVIAEIHRGASATYIAGKDIILVDYLNTTALANDSVLLVHMSANSVDSDQYVDGSIDLEHMNQTVQNQNLATTNSPIFAGLSLKQATNADRNIEFASDADLLWDESEDRFNFNKQVRGNATCYGVYGNATCYGVYGNATCYGVVGSAGCCNGVHGGATCYGVYGCATCNCGVYGRANCCYGVYGRATCYGVYGCATCNCGVYGRANCCYGVYGRATCCYGVYGYAVTNYPVAGNGAYYNSSTKYLKQPTENICLTNCLLKTPLPVYKWRWEDSNQRGFDEFVAPYAQDLQKTFGLTEKDDGYYTMDGIALGLGIELLKEIQFLKKRIKTLEEKVNGN